MHTVFLLLMATYGVCFDSRTLESEKVSCLNIPGGRRCVLLWFRSLKPIGDRSAVDLTGS